MGRNNKLTFLKVIFTYALFSPSFYNYLDTKGLAIVNGGLIILFVIYFIMRRIRKIYFHTKMEKLLFLFILFSFVLYFILIGISSLINNSKNLTLLDIADYNKPAVMLISFIFPFITLERENIHDFYKFTNRFFILSLFVIFIFGLFHLFGNDYLKKILSFYTKEDVLTTFRIATPFVNPYDLAIFLILIFTHFIYFSLITGRIKYAFVAFISVVILLFTQSRIGFVSLVYASLLIYLFSLFGISKVKRAFPIITFAIIFLALIYIVYKFYYLSYLFGGIQSYLQGESFSSWDIRKSQIEFVVNTMEKNILAFLIGFGPAKDVIRYIENNHFYYFFRYGFIGWFFFFIFPSVLGIIYSFRSIRIVQNVYEKAFYFSILIWFITIISVASLGNNFSEQMRLSFFYHFFIGTAIRNYYIHKNWRKNDGKSKCVYNNSCI